MNRLAYLEQYFCPYPPDDKSLLKSKLTSPRGLSNTLEQCNTVPQILTKMKFDSAFP